MTKKRVLVAAALLLGMLASSRATAQMVALSCPPICPGTGYVAPVHPFVGYGYPAYGYPAYGYPGYGYPAYGYYPYPLPPAPSFGFGRGGIYGHTFVPRDDVITGFTIPGGSPER
jgi:hypothetical protein